MKNLFGTRASLHERLRRENFQKKVEVREDQFTKKKNGRHCAMDELCPFVSVRLESAYLFKGEVLSSLGVRQLVLN